MAVDHAALDDKVDARLGAGLCEAGIATIGIG